MNAAKRYGDLTPTQFRIVDALSRHGDLTLPKVAEVIGHPVAHLGRPIASLRSQRVVRAPILETGQVLQLTERGRDVAA